jgi:hypothetical protein
VWGKREEGVSPQGRGRGREGGREGGRERGRVGAGSISNERKSKVVLDRKQDIVAVVHMYQGYSSSQGRRELPTL